MTSVPAPDGWSPDPVAFADDLEAKPGALARLASDPVVPAAIADVPRQRSRVLFLGMGSSRYAAVVAARRLRAGGIDAVAELASTEALPPPDPSTLVVGISAGGTSTETVAAMRRYAGSCTRVAITNEPGSVLAAEADIVVPMLAGHETGGVASRTFQHTGLLLRLLESQMTGVPVDFGRLCDRVASATAELLARRSEWLDPVSDLLDGPDGVHVIGPAERWSAVAQSALMFREGPRRPATASETGDWSHVDVYLTKTTDYRALLLTGSRFDAEAMAWISHRRATLVAVGGDLDGAAYTLRYEGDADDDTRLHTETLVAELVAARWWARASDSS